MLLEKTLEGPLDWKEIQPVHPKGSQSWIFIGRTDAEAETPILWPHDVKSWLIWKDPDVGKDWRWEEKGTTEDEMVGWDHWLNGHEFEQALGVDDGPGSLVFCSPRGHKVSDTTEWLNWNEIYYTDLCWQCNVSAFNTLSRFVIAFLLRSKPSNFMAAITIRSDSRAEENEVCYCFHFLPIYLPWSYASSHGEYLSATDLNALFQT